MIKIRHGTFETNSSSVHSLVWREYFYTNSISEEDYANSFSNVIDLYLNKDYVDSFSEKITRLFVFINCSEYDEIMVHAYENYGSVEFDIDESYCENMESNRIKFRDFYKKVKSNLLELIEEITRKKVEFINEEYFMHEYYDLVGFMPTEKDEIREFLLNKDLIFVLENDSDIEENAFVTENDIKTLIDKRKEEELTWFDWFKIERKDNA